MASRQRAERHHARACDADWHRLLLIGVVHAAGGLSNAVQTLKPSIRNWLRHKALTIFCRLPYDVVLGTGVLWRYRPAAYCVRCISYKDSKAVHRGIIIGTL